ncbi:hypothetical protein HDV03_003269 [Kappamyces sp. JEL0829]|nr:hypothetical protein HDV03_003269 [Kappamyces sp. JEL0829]KAJ3340821.1 hypothetical protein HDU91_000801 [Kappamyces sp. JEL0680]
MDQIIDKKFKFLWQPWARIQGFSAGVFILMGAIISIFFPQRLYMLISFGVSSLVILMDYPLVTIPFIGTNYWVKGFLYLVFAASGMLQAPTHTGSMCLACSGFTYLVAAYHGENGNPKEEKGRK